MYKLFNNQETDLEVQECTNSDECDEGDCIYPKFAVGNDFYENYVILQKWITKIRNFSPDVLIIACETHCDDVIKVIQNEEYEPNVAMGFNFESIIIEADKSGVNVDNWHYITSFNEEINYGEKNIYMGTTEDVVKIIDNKFNVYNSPNDFPNGEEDHHGNYRYYAEGYIIYILVLQQV